MVPDRCTLFASPSVLHCVRVCHRYPEAHAIPGVVIFRFDASLHFANKDYFASSFRAAMSGGVLSHEKCGGVTAAVIEFGSVNDVDASALRMLQDLLKDLKEQQVRLLLCNCNGPVLDVFERSGFTESITRESLCVSLSEAVKFGARLHAVRTGKADTTDLDASTAPSPKPTERRGSNASLSSLSESPAALDLPESLAPPATSSTSYGKARDIVDGVYRSRSPEGKARAGAGAGGGSGEGGSGVDGSGVDGRSSPGGRCGTSAHAGASSPASLLSDEEMATDMATDVSTSSIHSRRSSVEGDGGSPLPSVAEKEEAAVEVAVATADEPAGLANGSAHGESRGVRAVGGAAIVDGSGRQVPLDSMVDDDL